MKVELAGYGSVLLVDFFYYTQPSFIRLNQRYINTCFPSQFSNKVVSLNGVDLKKLSPAQNDILKKDFNKDFLQKCKEKNVDCILLDFINERLPLIRLKNGALLTYSNELKLTKYLSKVEFRIIEPYSKEYFEIWAACWDSFVRKASALGLLDKVVIQKVFWAKSTKLGNGFSEKFDGQLIYKNNAFLYQLYAYCSKDILAKNFIEYDPKDFLADDGHRWGVTPYHFSECFYKKMLVQFSARLNLMNLNS